MIAPCRRASAGSCWLASCAAIASAFAPAALAQPAGDPTPGTLAPLVALVTPMDGAVIGRSLRVQARVQTPAGLAQVSSVSVAITGPSSSTVSLTRNESWNLGADTGLYEVVVQLAPGSYTFVATATDSSARSTSSAMVSVTATADRGDGNLLVRDDSSQLCTACHALAPHGSETAGRTYGAWTTSCRDCHAPHGTRNTHLVRETIEPPWLTGPDAPAPRPVRVSRRTGYAPGGGAGNPGQASFANGDGSGPCQACHTRTSRWRAAGAADAIHLGDCAFCHRHQTGFKGRCEDCHASVPPATGAHAAHHGASAPEPPFPSDPRPLGCGSCHPTDPALHGDGVQQVTLNPSLTLPGGTSTSGAQVSGSGAGTSCTVACHFPLGAPTPTSPVTWSAAGPLPCTSCHGRIVPFGERTARAGPSLHDPIFSEARPASGEPTTCWSCHESASHDAAHLTGNPGLVASSAAIDAVCIACHSPPSGPSAGPQGQVLHRGSDAATSRTPPVLPGWSEATYDSTTGDFHGGRRGTCFGSYGPEPCAAGVTPTGHGGTLKAPYYRGYSAMPCTACHAGHASGNAFLFASVVNGTPVPAGSIDRTGVGAEKLCEACHEGGRHDRCIACHTDTYTCDQNAQCWMEGPNHIDPAGPGSACFWCHGHEGILKWTSPYGPHREPPTDCSHCHSGLIDHGANPPLTVPPHLAAPTLPYGAPQVTGITSTSATISWTTDEACSTWVEYGVGTPGYVIAGTAASASNPPGYLHTVALSDLTPGTTYVWRVRSVDAYRNVLRTAIATTSTIPADGVPYPDVIPVGWPGDHSSTYVVTLSWYPVTAPNGHPVEYFVQLADDPGFVALVNGYPPTSGWIAATSFAATLTNLPPDDCGDPIPSNTYYWRVKARDSVTGIESVWSLVDVFHATEWDSNHCGY